MKKKDYDFIMKLDYSKLTSSEKEDIMMYEKDELSKMLKFIAFSIFIIILICFALLYVYYGNSFIEFLKW